MLDPATLDLRGEGLRARAPTSAPVAPYLGPPTASATLADGTNVIAWTDAATGRVVAEVLAPGAPTHGVPLAVSESADVLGLPRLVTDGHAVVAVYFATHGEGYDLVASRVPTPRPRRDTATACNDALRADLAPRATAWGEALEPRESAGDRLTSAGTCARR